MNSLILIIITHGYYNKNINNNYAKLLLDSLDNSDNKKAHHADIDRFEQCTRLDIYAKTK